MVTQKGTTSHLSSAFGWLVFLMEPKCSDAWTTLAWGRQCSFTALDANEAAKAAVTFFLHSLQGKRGGSFICVYIRKLSQIAAGVVEVHIFVILYKTSSNDLHTADSIQKFCRIAMKL